MAVEWWAQSVPDMVSMAIAIHVLSSLIFIAFSVLKETVSGLPQRPLACEPGNRNPGFPEWFAQNSECR